MTPPSDHGYPGMISDHVDRFVRLEDGIKELKDSDSKLDNRLVKVETIQREKVMPALFGDGGESKGVVAVVTGQELHLTKIDTVASTTRFWGGAVSTLLIILIALAGVILSHMK